MNKCKFSIVTVHNMYMRVYIYKVSSLFLYSQNFNLKNLGNYCTIMSVFYRYLHTKNYKPSNFLILLLLLLLMDIL